MSETGTPPASPKGRRQLVAIWLLFLAPVVAAWLAWQVLSDSPPTATTNAGTLITPARPLQPFQVSTPAGEAVAGDALRGKWSYVVFSSTAGCDQRCQDQLYITRQTHTAMSKDVHRVQRVLVLAGKLEASVLTRLQAEHPGLLIVVAAPALSTQFDVDPWRSDGAAFFLVDPLGNLMMAYTLDVEPRGLRRDLRRLLKISQIG